MQSLEPQDFSLLFRLYTDNLMGITACELATPRWGMYSLYLLRFAKLAITSLRPPKFETCSACQFQLPSTLFYFCVIPEYNPAGSAATFGLKFVSSRRNGTTTFTSLRNFRSSASRCRSVTLSASINADRRRSCPRAAQTQTHTHIHGAGWCRGTYTHARTWRHGAPAAPSHRSVGPSPSLSRAHGADR